MCIQSSRHQTLRVVKLLVSFSHFFPSHHVYLIKTSVASIQNVTITVWKLEAACLYEKHILTLITLHNHVHQVQRFSTSFHLQYDSNVYMSWQLKTLSEAIMCFSWHQVPNSLVVNTKEFSCNWMELQLKCSFSQLVSDTEKESRNHYFFSHQCPPLPVNILFSFWLCSFSGFPLPGFL